MDTNRKWGRRSKDWRVETESLRKRIFHELGMKRRLAPGYLKPYIYSYKQLSEMTEEQLAKRMFYLRKSMAKEDYNRMALDWQLVLWDEFRVYLHPTQNRTEWSEDTYIADMEAYYIWRYTGLEEALNFGDATQIS